ERRALPFWVSASHLPSPVTMLEGVSKCPPGGMLGIGGRAAPSRVALPAAFLLAEGARGGLLEGLAAGERLDERSERDLEVMLAEHLVDQLRRALSSE